MSPSLAARMERLAASATSAVAGGSFAAASASGDGPPSLDLAAGEPDWAPPPGALEAARAALTGRVPYGRPGGEPELLEAVLARSPFGGSEWWSATGEAPQRVRAVATAGGKEALLLALGAVVTPGDRVVLPAPHWPTFLAQIHAWGGEPLVVPPDERGLPDTEQLARACAGARVLLVNSPSNPSGVAFDAEHWELVAELAERHDLWVLVDAVYSTLGHAADCEVPRAFADRLSGGRTARLLVVDSASKRLALPGLRLGWAVGAALWIEALRRLQDAASTHPALPAQRAALAGLEAEPDWSPAVRARLSERADAVARAVASSPELSLRRPDGGLFALLGLPPGVDAEHFAAELRVRQALKLVPGTSFAAPGTLRLALRASPAELTDAVGRIRAALDPAAPRDRLERAMR